jgi:hypothetical protein
MDYYGWQEWEKGGHGNGRSTGCGWRAWLALSIILSFFVHLIATICDIVASWWRGEIKINW